MGRFQVIRRARATRWGIRDISEGNKKNAPYGPTPATYGPGFIIPAPKSIYRGGSCNKLIIFIRNRNGAIRRRLNTKRGNWIRPPLFARANPHLRHTQKPLIDPWDYAFRRIFSAAGVYNSVGCKYARHSFSLHNQRPANNRPPPHPAQAVVILGASYVGL